MQLISIPRLLKRIRKNSHNTINYAAQLSYGVLLAILPGMMIYYMVATYFFSSSSQILLRAIEVVFPPGILDYSETQGNLVQQTRKLSLFYMNERPILSLISFFLVLFFVVYAMIRVVRSMMVITNRVSQFKERRSFVKLWIDAFYNCIVLSMLIFLAIYFYIVTTQAGDAVISFFMASDNSFLNQLFVVIGYVYLLTVLVLILTWCYSVFPSERLRIYQALPGAITSVVLWILVTNFLRVLQLHGLWPVGQTDLTRAINLFFYAFVFAYLYIMGAIVNVQIIRMNRTRNYSDSLIAARAVKHYETRSIKTDTIQLGRVDHTLLQKKYHPDMTTKERFTELYNQVVRSMTDTNFPGICTQLAFYLICAVVPFLVYLLEFVSTTTENFQEGLYGVLESMLPQLSYQYIISEISELMRYADTTQYFMAIATLIFTCVSIHSLLSGINQTYGFSRYRLRRELWIKSLIYTVFLAVACEILMQVYRISESLRAWFHSLLIFGLPDEMSASLYVFLFSEIVLFLILSSIYSIAPEQRLGFKRVLPGTIFSVVALSIVFRIYLFFLNRSQTYIMIYGSQSGLFILLVVMFFFSCVLNIGAKLNVFFSPNSESVDSVL